MDNSADEVKFKEDLMNIARTTLSSKLLNVEKDHFAQLAVDAVLRLKGSGNLDHIQVITMRTLVCCCDCCLSVWSHSPLGDIDFDSISTIAVSFNHHFNT